MMDNNSYNQMRQEFSKKFRQKISPLLDKFETKRKIFLALACILSSVFLICALYILYYSLTSISDFSDKINFWFGTAIMASLAYGCWKGFKDVFEDNIKSKVMNDVCRCFGELTYSKTPKKYLNLGNLVPKFNRKYFDDIFYGKYKDINYSIIETKLDMHIDKLDITVFNGVIIQFDMKKRFEGNTVILPKTSVPISPDAQLKHTSMEDPVFNQKFDVFTTDETEARYLITPSFMERLNHMQVSFSADKISCAFFEKNLLIGLHTKKDLFSIGSLIKPANDAEQFFALFEEILSIIQLIDYFKLDQNIGL